MKIVKSVQEQPTLEVQKWEDQGPRPRKNQQKDFLSEPVAPEHQSEISTMPSIVEDIVVKNHHLHHLRSLAPRWKVEADHMNITYEILSTWNLKRDSGPVRVCYYNRVLGDV